MGSPKVNLPTLPEGFSLDAPQASSAPQTPKLPDGFTLDQPAGAQDPDAETQGDFTKALGFGLANALHGTANTIDKYAPAGDPNSNWGAVHDIAKQAMEGVSKAAQTQGVDPQSYGKTQTQQVHWNSPSSWWNHGPYALAENAPGLAVSVAAPELRGLGFLASEFLQHGGDNLDQRVQNNGGKPATTTDKIISGASTAAEGALGKFGLGKLNAIPGKGAIANLAAAGAANAGAGAAGDVLNQVGRAAGTQQGLNVDPTEVGNAATMGGITGAALRGIQTPGDVVNNVRMRPLGGNNADVSADLANRLSQTGAEISSPSGAFKAHSIVSGDIADAIKSAQKPLQAEGGLLSSRPDLDQQVSSVVNRLNNGITLKPAEMDALQASLGDDGSVLAHNIRLANVQNIVKGFGNFDSGDQTHQGGITGSPFGKVTSPMSFISSPGSHGAASNLIVKALGLKEAAHVLGWGNLGLVAGGAAAIRPVFKGIDSVLGLRNPTSEFVNRFQGSGFTPPTNPPPAVPPEVQGQPNDTSGNPMMTNAAWAQITKNKMDAAAALDKVKQMQGFMGQKGSVGLPENPSFEATQAQTPGEQQAQSFQGFMPKGGANGLPEALRFEGSTPPPPEVQGTGPLNRQALAQIALNKMARENVGADAQTGENAQAQILAHLATLRQQGLAMMNRRALGGAQVPQGSPQASQDPVGAPQAPMAPQAAPVAPMAPPPVGQDAPAGPVFATKARIKQVPMAPPEAANPGAIPETPASVPNSIKVNGPAPARPPLGGIADKAMGELYARINANKYTPDRLDKTPGVDPEQGDFIVNHAGLTATRDSASIDHPDAYKTAVEHNLDVRGNFRDELKSVLPESAGKDVDKLAQLLTNQHVTRVKAEAMIIDLMTEHSGEKHGPAFDKVLMKHIKGLMGTYGQ